MKKACSSLFLGVLLTAPALLQAQTFTRRSDLLSNQTARSGGCTGVADMDGDGYDDIILLNLSKNLYIDYQSAAGTFTSYNLGAVSSASQWGMAIGDADGDGHKDFVSGGNGDGVHFMEISARGSGVLSSLNNGNMFMQCMNMADINNDGALDVFGCHDVAAPRIWLNNGSGSLSYNDYVNFATTPASDMSGNYGSVWIDFDNDGDLDLYITHCRQGHNDPNDVLRWNRLFVNDGTNHYTDQAAAFGMQNREQSWTTDFGDIDNDGDLDAVTTNHSTTVQLFLNDGTGHYTNATAGSGLAVSGFFLQSKLEDLDNDGFLDLIIAGGEYYFRGNGNGTFTQVSNMLPEPGTGYTLHGFATGDLDHNGTIDIYANYGTNYVDPSSTKYDQLYLNNGNGNHFLNFNLKGVQSNRDGVGARVTLYGPWGKQIREVRAGESYGIVCSFTCHFGLGTQLEADSAVIRWPSGTVDRFYKLAADQWVDVTEGETKKAVVAMKVFLGGPYQTGDGLMSDALRTAGLVPAQSPYAGAAFTVVGDDVLGKLAPSVRTVTGPNAIVDWVWLELRDAASPYAIRRARPALLQRDGDVVELDGRTPVPMGLANGSYNVVVKHRNHFGAMTATAVSLGATPTVIDLTSAGTATWGTDARRSLGAVMVLWPGNTSGDGLIKYTGSGNDRDPILVSIGGSLPTATTPGYLPTDVNMDGIVKYTGANNDRDPVLVSVGGSLPTAIRTLQLPTP